MNECSDFKNRLLRKDSKSINNNDVDNKSNNDNNNNNNNNDNNNNNNNNINSNNCNDSNNGSNSSNSNNDSNRNDNGHDIGNNNNNKKDSNRNNFFKNILIRGILVTAKFRSYSADEFFETIINGKTVYFIKFVLPHVASIIHIQTKTHMYLFWIVCNFVFSFFVKIRIPRQTP